MKKIFSLPINPKVPPEFIKRNFVGFLNTYKDYIYDLYFTCRMPPFTQDAMGELFVSNEHAIIDQALWVRDKTGIPLSATFNNIYVRPDQRNLDMWIENYKSLYDAGIHIVTLPHTSWVSTGQIQKEYPKLFIKNTILRDVTRPNEVVELARAGFHYVNLDRDLMRDRDRLLEIKEAKDYCEDEGYPVKLSLLVNEGCWGNCPIMTEHYHYNNTRQGSEPQYFNDTISRVSCSKWDALNGVSALKAANLPPWKEDWEEFLDLGIDVFKMHGRESGLRLQESMGIIERWVLGEREVKGGLTDILFPQYREYMDDVDLKERPIDVWREKIKTCKFNCWKCNYCDLVYESGKGNNKVNPKVPLLLDAIDNAEKRSSNYERIAIDGLTSNITRHFLNNLCSVKDTVYLELGCYAGSTFYSALQNNEAKGYAVDNFKGSIAPFRDDIVFMGYDNPKEEFEKHKNDRVVLIEDDIGSIDIPEKCNVVFYDADNDPISQYKNLLHVYNFCADEFILIVDDANFEGVVESTNDFITTKKLNIIFERKILTTVPEDVNSWWNGIYILLLQK